MHIEAWNLYFPEEQYTVYNEAIDMIKKFKEDIKSLLDANELERDRIFNLDYKVFSKLTQDFKDRNHETIIDCLSCAVSEVLHNENLNLFRVRTRLLNFGDLNVEISPDNCGRLTSLVGTVCRIGFKKIVLLKAFFECTKCHEVLSVSLLNNIYSPLKKCLGTCKSRTFTFLFHHQSTIMRDVQEIKIQENNTVSDEYQVKEGIDCLIYDEHVGTISPGDVLRVCGIICAENESNSLYKLVIRVNNLEHFNSKQNLKKSDQKKDNYEDKVGKASKDDYENKAKEDKNKEANGIKVNEDKVDKRTLVNTYLVKDSDNTFITPTPTPIITDFDLFKKISRTVNIIPTLIHSLYPGIFGHELIKVGLLLSLFGGTRKYVGHSSIRSEIHTLIIGDPGLGKSRMLLGSCTVLPKSTYISGNLATTAGLTVSLTHDPQTGDFMADAGALVVADNGVCCMDEFDKIDDHSALFEAMEEQKVTVAKGGVVCSIPTRATIIAASNPKYGHFNKSKSIRENLRFDNALLSRFDLIFILVDDLNEKENYEISDQILKKRRQSTEGDFINTGSNFSLDLICSSLRTDPFLKNLSKPETLIPLEQVRKYINYARNSVFPVLSTAAKEEIKKFYLEIRIKKSITTRDLESLIRLTEFRAKIELRSIATREDAGFAIDLYKRVLKREDVKKKSKKGNLKDLVEEIKNKNEILTKNELVDLIKKFELNKPVDEIIETLNYKGVIIKKGNNEYKVV